ELGEQVLATKVAAGPGDLVAQGFGHGEMLEERDDVSESLVEGENVSVGRFAEAAVESIGQCGGSVGGAGIMGQATEDDLPGEVIASILFGGAEVTEQEGFFIRAVERVGLAQGVRVDAQPLDKLFLQAVLDLEETRRPEGSATQGAFKVLNG